MLIESAKLEILVQGALEIVDSVSIKTDYDRGLVVGTLLLGNNVLETINNLKKEQLVKNESNTSRT
jgi:hypothetical protein